MSFRKKDMQGGVGRYEYLPDKLPPLWLLYCEAAQADSNTVHQPVKQRWLDGDAEVVRCAKELAELADTGRCARARGHAEQRCLSDTMCGSAITVAFVYTDCRYSSFVLGGTPRRRCLMHCCCRCSHPALTRRHRGPSCC